MAEDESAGSTTKKTAAKKTARKRSPSKKSSAKKSTTKKSATKKTSSSAGAGKRAPRAESAPKPSGSRIAEAATRQLAELTDKDIEGVTGLQKTDDGWQVELEVLELRRIPNTTDVMATYELSLDSSGELERYRRVRRFVRGQAEDGV